MDAVLREEMIMLRKNLTIVMILLICVTGSMLYGIPIGAEQGRETAYHTYELNKGELFLRKKGTGYVMANKMRLEINSSTVINDWRGNDITLEELQVPSKAVVEHYKKANQVNTSIAVSIQEVLIPE
jgi:hypothetical protein